MNYRFCDARLAGTAMVHPTYPSSNFVRDSEFGSRVCPCVAPRVLCYGLPLYHPPHFSCHPSPSSPLPLLSDLLLGLSSSFPRPPIAPRSSQCCNREMVFACFYRVFSPFLIVPSYSLSSLASSFDCLGRSVSIVISAALFLPAAVRLLPARSSPVPPPVLVPMPPIASVPHPLHRRFVDSFVCL